MPASKGKQKKNTTSGLRAGGDRSSTTTLSMERIYDRSPTPEEVFEGYHGEDWEVEAIKEEELNILNDSYFAVQWTNWARPDGSNTTWTRDDNPDDDINKTDLPKNFSAKLKKNLEARATKSLDVDLNTLALSSLHNILSAEKLEAIEYKRERFTRQDRLMVPDVNTRTHTPDATGITQNSQPLLKRTASTVTLQSESERPPATKRRVGPSPRIPTAVASSSRGTSSSTMRSESSSTPTRATRKTRGILEKEWNETAKLAGVTTSTIRIVNDVDDEEVPELPKGFQWLEATYATPPRQQDILLFCKCPDMCLENEDCSCPESSDLPDGLKNAYSVEGLLREELVDYRGAFLIQECNHECSCGDDCVNKVSQKPRNVALEIFKTPNERGWGVRARGELPRGKIIGICTGKLEHRDSPGNDEGNEGVLEVDSEGDAIMQDASLSRTQQQLACSGYCFNLDWDGADNTWVNAYQHGNWTRFVNHSCSPNLRFFTVRRGEMSDQGELSYVAMVTTQEIPRRTELTVDYRQGVTGQRKRTKTKGKGKAAAKALEECRCGSAECRGSVWD